MIVPKSIGDGTNAQRLIIINPKPIATGLSFSSTHLKIIPLLIIYLSDIFAIYLTVTKKFETRPVAPVNFNKQTTATNK